MKVYGGIWVYMEVYAGKRICIYVYICIYVCMVLVVAATTRTMGYAEGPGGQRPRGYVGVSGGSGYIL